MVTDQGWTVVGKGRGSGSRKTKHGSISAPISVLDPIPREDVPTVSCGAEVGWGDGDSSSSGRRCRRRHAGQPLTLEERVKRLQALVQDCRREVLDSSFYARFQSVVGAAASTGPSPSRASQNHQGMDLDGTDAGRSGSLPADAESSAQPCPASRTTHDAATAVLPAVSPAVPPLASSLHCTPLACVEELVIYGLGSPEDSRVSRYQLALALLLIERHLPTLMAPTAPARRILAFDPAFSELDCRLLEGLGIDVLTHNEGGARKAGLADGNGTTLFYMPHCEGVLCDSLLGANWSCQALPRVIILGNSFESYRKRWSMQGAGNSTTATRPHRLLQLVEAGVVRELHTSDCGFHSASAFNDMSLHTFSEADCWRFFT